VNKKLERMQEEAAVAKFEALFRGSRAETEKTAERIGQDSQCAGRDSKRSAPEYVIYVAASANLIGTDNVKTNLGYINC
jgi:hypothetical protein